MKQIVNNTCNTTGDRDCIARTIAPTNPYNGPLYIHNNSSHNIIIYVMIVFLVVVFQVLHRLLFIVFIVFQVLVVLLVVIKNNYILNILKYIYFCNSIIIIYLLGYCIFR